MQRKYLNENAGTATIWHGSRGLKVIESVARAEVQHRWLNCRQHKSEEDSKAPPSLLRYRVSAISYKRAGLSGQGYQFFASKYGTQAVAACGKGFRAARLLSVQDTKDGQDA